MWQRHADLSLSGSREVTLPAQSGPLSTRANGGTHNGTDRSKGGRKDSKDIGIDDRFDGTKMSIHGLDTGLWIILQPFFLSALLENWVLLIKSSFQAAHWLPVSPVFPSLLEMKAGEISDQKWMWKGHSLLKRSSFPLLGFYTHTCRFEGRTFPECLRGHHMW